ncbi:hypothetical protein ZYGR_0H04290 [Zygosaccharomyces rouxii]|uniref:UvrD-like helicase ATP-binding domain-containing protein n=1 Tax=Zygosaccharomyces rouxii TaxID=4956 RepID=A0A1Q2ZWB4_ZYGRO|nr:hypothetical protein ZYGR_0H04290 [Zygosaccharomyces rouxii]
MSSADSVMEQRYEVAKGFIPTIEKVYAGTNGDMPEANLLGELLKLLAELPGDFHLFCDPTFEPISVFCLTIFSFNEQGTVSWLKNKFNPTLASCDKCILNFTRGKCKMLQHFAVQRHVPHEHVSKFNDIVCLWRSESVFPVLHSISVNGNTEVKVTREIELALFECLCNPHILRLKNELRLTFNAIFTFMFHSELPFLDPYNPDFFKTFVAGIIFCWCEGTKDEIKWAKTVLNKLHRENYRIDLKNFGSDVLEEINIHLLFLQNPANWNEVVVSQFWSRLIPIFALFDKEIFTEFFEVPKNIDSLKKTVRFPIESIYKMWYNHLGKTYRDKPLEFLLRALCIFLEKLGASFWSKLEPFTFHSILDIVFDKDIFANKLVRVQNNPIPDDEVGIVLSFAGSITDMVSWTLPFYKALSTSKRIQMVKKVSMAFLRAISNHNSLKSIPKACLMNSSTALLRAVLTIRPDELAMLYERQDFEVVLYSKTDSRALLNNPLIQEIVLRSATNPMELYPDLGDSAVSVSTSAMMVLTKAINFDILMLCEATYKLYSGRQANDLNLTPALLNNLTSRLDLRSFHDGPLLAKQLLISFNHINGLLTVEKSKDTSTQRHNALIKQYYHHCTKIVEKFADILPNQLSKILAEEGPAQGFWSCIFSSNTELYQAATNILYDTFDVEGRFEGIHAILKNNLTNQLRAINLVLHQLIKCEFYEPCPRAIRVLMDVVSAFSDPVAGILANYQTLKNDKTDIELNKIWELTWSFLDTIYRCTLNWATKYEYSELENFTKDTLDLSRSLVDSYREFSDALGDSKIDLFESVVKAFKNMLYWLRLSDDALLDSCVRLIVSASDLASEKAINFDDSLVEMMAKYGAKAKKFSNKLSDQQSREILMKAETFNKPLTDRTVSEAEAYHKEKELAKLGRTTSPSPQPDVTTSATESKADFLQRKATSSSITGRPKAMQSKITSFGSFQPSTSTLLHQHKPIKPLSKMELARRQLMSNRVVHPPSSTVFNNRRTVAKANDESSSDESEGDIETARELFASAKSRGKGIQTVDMTGKVVTKTTTAEREKLDRENMRRRLNVDLNPFYESILQWDYCRSDEYPDDNIKDHCADLKDEFKSVSEYQKIVRPLLLLECWQGLCSARDRGDFRPFSIIVGNRTAVSDFYEVYASVSKKKLQESNITDSDLIVLAYFPNNVPGGGYKNEDFKHATDTCLAKVRTLKNTKGDNVDLTLRVHRNHKFAKFLTLRSEIHAVKIMQMTTVEREYTSLEALEYYDLVEQILRAKPTPQMDVSQAEIDLIKKKYNLNLSQAAAIVNTVLKEGFSLIQGPPGTGKTKTILGIVGYFLSTRSSLPSNAIKTPGADSSNMTTDQLLKKQKVLICAPSNAAVDEIVLRLKEGVCNKEGMLFKPNIVRVGRSDAVNAAIKDFTLEELVDKQVSQKNYEFSKNPELEKKFNEAVHKRRELRAKLDAENGTPTSTMSTEDIANLQLKIRELSRQLNELGRERDLMRERNSVNYRNRDLDRRNAQARTLAKSDIICSTLSGSAHDVLSSLGVKFDTVIIDEACQCTELSSIIPLRYGGRRCIMVGDPNQLPPTVLSGAASSFKYNQSLFVRMEKNITPYLLDVQYRMHSSISKFPSMEFYKSRLKDGPEVDTLNQRPWHELKYSRPYKFFDILTGREQQSAKTMSYVNLDEIKVAMELVEYLFHKFDKIDFTSKIGVISPYKEQASRMRREFLSRFGGTITREVDFNTIDGFQGQEKEIIIISCVRADDTKSSVGFLRDFRRMNVALTRAKTSMWILGHQKSLVKNKLWNRLITDAQQRGCMEVACPGFLNSRNHKAQETLEKYRARNDPSLLNDDYDPLANMKPESKTPSKRRSDNLDAHPRKMTFDEKKRKEEKATATSQTKKKKSSIFGAPSIANEVTSSGAYIKEKGKPETRKESLDPKKNRHVGFSDNLEIIPRGDDEDVGESPPAGKQKENKSGRSSPPLQKSDSDSDEEENDYTPRPPEDTVLPGAKKQRSDFEQSFYDDYQPPAPKEPIPLGSRGGIREYPENIPSTNGSNRPDRNSDQRPPHNGSVSENRAPLQGMASQGPQHMHKSPSPSSYNASRSNTAGSGRSGGRHQSSNPFIPKKKPHHR